MLPMSEQTTKSQNVRAISKRLWSTPLADGSIPFVRMQQLWDMAAGLPSKKVRVSDLNALDEIRWFSERMQKLPTCRAVAEHARDIYEVDFQFPIILSPSRTSPDGGCSRTARRWNWPMMHPNKHDAAS